MKKKIIAALVILGVLLTLTACNGESLGYTAGGAHLVEYTDKETGVCYLIVEGRGICVEYNADGTIKTKEVSE